MGHRSSFGEVKAGGGRSLRGRQMTNSSYFWKSTGTEYAALLESAVPPNAVGVSDDTTEQPLMAAR